MQNTQQMMSKMRYRNWSKKRRIVAGIVTAAVVNVLYVPVYFTAIFIFFSSITPRDPTGRGGPFKACLPGEYCVGPTGSAYLMMTVCVLVVLFGLLLAGIAGQRVGGFKAKRRAIATLALGGIIVGALLVYFNMWAT